MDNNVLNHMCMLPNTIREPLRLDIDGSERGVAFLYALDRFEQRAKQSPHDTPFDLTIISLKATFAEPATVDADVSIFANWLAYRRRHIPFLTIETAGTIFHDTVNELLSSVATTSTRQLHLSGFEIMGPHSNGPVPPFSSSLFRLRISGPAISQDYLSAWVGQYHRSLRHFDLGDSREVRLRPHPRIQHLDISVPSRLPFDELPYLLNPDVQLRRLHITGMQIPHNLHPAWTFRNLPRQLDTNVLTALTLIRCSENKMPLTKLTCRPTSEYSISFDVPGIFLDRLHTALGYLPRINTLNVALPRFRAVGDSVFAKTSTRAFHTIKRLSIAFSQFSLRDVLVRIAFLAHFPGTEILFTGWSLLVASSIPLNSIPSLDCGRS
jgi:hypothetical protein